MLVIHSHALIHGVEPDDIRSAFANSVEGAMPQDDDPPRWLLVGFDTAGRLIELVVVERSSGDYLAIHAMRARKTTIQQLRNSREGR